MKLLGHTEAEEMDRSQLVEAELAENEENSSLIGVACQLKQQ